MKRLPDPTFDHRIADWLEDDPSLAPNEVLGTILAAFPSIDQRRASRVPWRFPSMNPIARVAGAAIAVALGVVVVAIAVRPGGIGGPPSPTPTPPIADGSYAVDVPVADILSKLDATTLPAVEKQAIIGDVLAIRGATMFNVRASLAGDSFLVSQGTDGRPPHDNGPWHVTRNDGLTIAFDRISAGTPTAEYRIIRSADGLGFRLRAITPADSEVETFVRAILFDSADLRPVK